MRSPGRIGERIIVFVTIAISILASAPWLEAEESGDPSPLGVKEGSIIVTDSVGRSVEVPGSVKRIGCLYAFTGHAATMLGRCQDIVAISNGLRRDSLLHEICPNILKALVPKAQGAINLEELVRAELDLLFLSGDIGRDKAEMEKLASLKIPFLIVDYTSIEEQQRAVEMVGMAIGARDMAAKYVRYYQACVDRVRSVTDTIPDSQRLRLYHSVNEANRTTIKEGLTTDWLKVEGIKNVALTQSTTPLEGRNFVSMEQILLWNPDVILVNEPNVIRYILQDKQWTPIKAVKEDRVYQMPIGISRWGHPGSIETPLAILWTAKKLYPEHFQDMDMFFETKKFYGDFFRYELTDDMVNRILSGKLKRKPKKMSD